MTRRKYLRSDLARDLGLSRASVTMLAARGMPTNSADAAREWRRANLDPAFAKPDGAPLQASGKPIKEPRQQSEFQRARTEREEFTARRVKLDYEMRIGKLVHVDEIAVAYADTLATCRDELLTIPDRCAAKVAASKEVGECWRIIDEAVRSAMRHLVGEPADSTERTAEKAQKDENHE